MNTIITNPIKTSEEKTFVSKITDIISSIGFISEKDRNYTLPDHISYLLKASENSEPKTRNKIENHLVKLGKKAVPALVTSLFTTTGATRGLIAMTLIRIGKPSISHLEKAVLNYPESIWISDYIIKEIEGSQSIIGAYKAEQAMEPALVG